MDVSGGGWSDLRWCLFLGKGNVFAGAPLDVEAVLADFDALPDGAYEATFAVTDAAGRRFWEAKRTFTVPQLDADGLRAVVHPVLKERVAVDLPEGEYMLRAYLDHGGYAAAHEKAFYVTARTRTGFYDWDWWTDCFPMWGFRTSPPAESISLVNFNVGGPGEYAAGLALATFRHGKGRLVVSTLPLDVPSPAAACIRANLRATSVR